MVHKRTDRRGLSVVSRRQVLQSGLAGCAGCVLAGCAGGNGSSSGSEAGIAPDIEYGPVDAGPLSDYRGQGVYDALARRGFFLVRRAGRLFAVSSICTHQHVLLDAGDTDLGCPRHGSLFSIEGVVLKAPARRSLPHHPIRLDERGHLIVDTSVDLDKPSWDAPGASVAV